MFHVEQSLRVEHYQSRTIIKVNRLSQKAF